MISLNGLASVTCESRPARVLAGAAIVLDLLAFYFIIAEVGCARYCVNATSNTEFAPHMFARAAPA